MEVTKIYGASDDLIEIEGQINDELNVYLKDDEELPFSVSDGTKGLIKYDDEGQWRINVLDAGTLCIKKIAAVGDDAAHAGEAAGCSSYSDVLILGAGVEWVKIGKRKFKRK